MYVRLLLLICWHTSQKWNNQSVVAYTSYLCMWNLWMKKEQETCQLGKSFEIIKMDTKITGTFSMFFFFVYFSLLFLIRERNRFFIVCFSLLLFLLQWIKQLGYHTISQFLLLLKQLLFCFNVIPDTIKGSERNTYAIPYNV